MSEDIILSEYQKNILNFVEYSRGNLLVDAKAGSGKTFTLMLIAKELARQGKKCLYMAYNRSIVEELSKKLPNESVCKCLTTYSAGYKFIQSYLCRKYGLNNFVVNTDKTGSRLRQVVTEYYDKYFKDVINIYCVTGERDRTKISGMLEENNYKFPSEMKSIHKKLINEFIGLCNYSRTYNINYKKDGSLDFLVKRFCDELIGYIDENVLFDYQNLVIYAIDKIKELFENPPLSPEGLPLFEIGYTDMIYFPVYYNMSIPSSIKNYLDTILIDERSRFEHSTAEFYINARHRL